MKSRKFRLRNGIVVQEKRRLDSFEEGGYINDYIILEGKHIEGYEEVWLCLMTRKDGFPIGAVHGRGFDIVEEIPE